MQNKDYFTNLMKKMDKNTQQNIKTSYLAKIVKLTLPTCSVQPLAMINGKKLPMVEDVNFVTIPIQYMTQYTDTVGQFEIKHDHEVTIVNKKLNYHVGDTVLVDVLDLDNSYFKNKGEFNVGSVRRHSMDYSVIVGKMADKNDFKFQD